jgi:hypothetical protein
LLEPGTLGMGPTRCGAKCRMVGFLAVGFRLIVKKERRWRRAHGTCSGKPDTWIVGFASWSQQTNREAIINAVQYNQSNQSLSTMPSPPRKKVPGPCLPPDHENWYINVDGFMGRNWYALITSLYCYVPHLPRDHIATNTKEVHFVRTFNEALEYLSDAGVGHVSFWVVNGNPDIHESRSYVQYLASLVI